MNETTKIDTKNGILSEGGIYHSAGFGSEEKSNTAKEALGLKAFCKLNSGAKFNIGMHGACDDIIYYLTTEQAEKWNAHIEEQELLEKAKALTPDGATFLGELGTIEGLSDGIELGGLSEYEINNASENFEWSDIGEWRYAQLDKLYFYTRPVKETDPLIERAKELAVDGIEILGFGRPEGYEIKEGYELSFIQHESDSLSEWRVYYSGKNKSFIYFQRKIKEESEPEQDSIAGKGVIAYHRDKWLEALTGEKPKDPFGSKNGTLSSVAKALYGKGGNQ